MKELLERAGITKAELSRRLGITANAVSGWKESPPRYAVAYLDLLHKYNMREHLIYFAKEYPEVLR